MQNPELAFEGRSCVYREGRLADDFGDEFNRMACFLQPRANFIDEGGLANAVGSDQGEFQMAPPGLEVRSPSSILSARRKQWGRNEFSRLGANFSRIGEIVSLRWRA